MSTSRRLALSPRQWKGRAPAQRESPAWQIRVPFSCLSNLTANGAISAEKNQSPGNGSLLGHVQSQVREQIGTRDQPKKFVVVHYDGDAAAIKYIQKILDRRFWRQRFQFGRHRFFNRIIKMRWIAVHFHKNIGLVEKPDRTSMLIED